ncbi:MAG: recombination mediator RecR [Syntrophales bacterium]|jgi:recombination protein RecR|nr:recombination mediator RecR [Syntrophales bacterium]MDD5232655.1 recombination mediator RecR [Syntrophales bacterium]MDD5531423.1 recombination mediator RecR [Syntrophales bacterium]HPL62128.1 recombination mediator RecR [Syntrophales bacterium]
MAGYAPPIKRLIEELGRFPGIGEKTASRLANFILQSSEDDARRLAESILDVKRKIRLCSVCFHLTEDDPCEICRNGSREKDIVCVVEDPDSLLAVEASGSFRGTYHVLHGTLSPLDGIGPDQLKLAELARRVEQDGVREVIIATNPSMQGDATALLIMKLLKDREIRITRIAFGIPVGGDLKYADRVTLAKALEFRRGM